MNNKLLPPEAKAYPDEGAKFVIENFSRPLPGSPTPVGELVHPDGNPPEKSAEYKVVCATSGLLETMQQIAKIFNTFMFIGLKRKFHPIPPPSQPPPR